MSGNAELVLPVEQGNTGIEAGDTCTGVIIGTGVREVEHDDGTSDYYEITVRENETDIEFQDASFNARITPGTDLGKALDRFGVDLVVGEEVALHDVFENGTIVEFEVDEEEYEDDDGNTRTALRLLKNTLRPEGVGKDVVEVEEEEESDSSDSGDSEEEPEPGDVEIGEEAERALEIIEEDELDGEEPKDVKRALAQRSGTLMKGYKDLLDAGYIYEDGDAMQVTPTE